ncbi:MAG: restriction endonuclease subunit S [Paludibacter sp.]|jgi:type I restriction enzyme S subunit|nr:restriction endonuclease subunit S [Paludibacter sp.]
MAKLKPYTEYNPVKYDYVTELPVGWQLLPNIAIFQERIERGHDNEELLSVTIGRGIIRQTDVEIKKDNSNEDKSKYKLIKVGDLAYNKMRMWQGALGYSEYQGITSPAYVVIKPKIIINPRYFHYLFRTPFYTNYCRRISYGIVDDQLSLRYTDFKRMYSIVPPLEIQNRIVEYLDKKNAKIDKFIRNKERLIELLEEQKRGIINIAITKGNSSVKSI